MTSTPSEKGPNSGQIEKLCDKVRSAARKSKIDSKRFQDALAHPGTELEDRFLRVLIQFANEVRGSVVLSINYDQPGAIAKAIEEAKFDWKYIGLSPENIPLVGTGQVEQEVREVHFGKIMYNRDLPNALKERGKELGFANGFKFADPLTILRYACALPDQQRKYPIAILFTDANGQLWCLYLYGHGGRRSLDVNRSYPGDDWFEHVRFLAVCELPLIA